MRVLFGCNQCGECCRHYYIPLTFYDLLRLSENQKLLLDGLELKRVDPLLIESAIWLYQDFYNIYLKYNQQAQSCQFYDPEQQCTIHPLRPRACRIYPFEKNQKYLRVMDSAQEIYTQHCDKTHLPVKEQKKFLEDIQLGIWENQQHSIWVRRWNESMTRSHREASLPRLFKFIQENLPSVP